MKTVRCFIGIDLPEAIKKNISEIIEPIRNKIDTSTINKDELNIKWVKPDGLHITLKFLNTIGEDTLEGVMSIISSIAKKTNPFKIEIDGTGAFPNYLKPKVLWIGIKDLYNGLITLQKKVDEGLKVLKFDIEKKAYKPHITIARIKGIDNTGEITKFIKENSKNGFGIIDVREVIIFESILLPDGATYNKIANYKLGK